MAVPKHMLYDLCGYDDIKKEFKENLWIVCMRQAQFIKYEVTCRMWKLKDIKIGPGSIRYVSDTALKMVPKSNKLILSFKAFMAILQKVKQKV